MTHVFDHAYVGVRGGITTHNVYTLPIRCRCGGDATATEVAWLTGDFTPTRAYYCFRCMMTWYAFDVTGGPPLIVTMDEKPTTEEWDTYLEQRLVNRQRN